MTEVQYWKDSIIKEIEEIRILSSSIQKKRDNFERSAAINNAEKKIRSATSKCKTLKSEIRIIANAEESSRYKKELSNYKEVLSQLSMDIQGFKSSEETRNRLFLGVDTTNNVDTIDHVRRRGETAAVVDPAVKVGDCILDETEGMQDNTQNALNNITSTIKETKDVAVTTLEELERQEEQIQNIDKNVGNIEGNLNRSDKLIKMFRKRIATDKVIQAFACINILLILCVIVYAVVRGGLKHEASEDDGNLRVRVR